MQHAWQLHVTLTNLISSPFMVMFIVSTDVYQQHESFTYIHAMFCREIRRTESCSDKNIRMLKYYYNLANLVWVCSRAEQHVNAANYRNRGFTKSRLHH